MATKDDIAQLKKSIQELRRGQLEILLKLEVCSLTVSLGIISLNFHLRICRRNLKEEEEGAGRNQQNQSQFLLAFTALQNMKSLKMQVSPKI